MGAFIVPLRQKGFESLGFGFAISEKKSYFLFWAWPMGTPFLYWTEK